MMWNCPICAAEHAAGGVCKKCGFDQSRNYEQNMTLCSTLPKDQKPIAVRAKEWRQKQTAMQIREALICPGCGSAQFHFSKGNREFVCVECGKKVPLSDAVTVESMPRGRLAFRSTIAAGNYHTVALKADGTVIAAGENKHRECNVSAWTDIISVAAGRSYTVGLHPDGTVITTGGINNSIDLSHWTGITAITASGNIIVGLKSDGTVIKYGMPGATSAKDGWSDIVSLAVGDLHIVGLRSDGTVVAVGINMHGQCNVKTWTDIVAVAAGARHTAGLRSDGTVIIAGQHSADECNVKTWRDLVAIDAGYYYTIGLKSDGSAVSTSSLYVGNWRDIVSIAAGGMHAVGLKSDGTMVAAGYNLYTQCNVRQWSNIQLPYAW